jgi:integrin beta 3
MTRDVQAAILRACARFIGKRLEPVELRLKAVEDRGAIIHKGIDGLHGRDGLPGPQGEKGLDGRDGLHGKDGRDGIDGKDGAPGRDGEKGLDGLPGERGPQGEKGEKGDVGERGPAGEAGPQGESGERGEKGLDGADGKDGLDGKDGAPGLNGKDGRDGLNGKDADEDAIVRRVLASVDAIVQKAIDAMPKPRDGRDGLPGVPGAPGEKGMDGRDGTNGIHGKDGRDGIDWSDFDAELDEDGRTIVIAMGKGDQKVVKRLKTSIPVFRHSWKADHKYEKGDCVNWGGSMWVALKDSPDRPSSEGSGWQLAVRRGADPKVS